MFSAAETFFSSLRDTFSAVFHYFSEHIVSPLIHGTASLSSTAKSLLVFGGKLFAATLSFVCYHPLSVLFVCWGLYSLFHYVTPLTSDVTPSPFTGQNTYPFCCFCSPYLQTEDTVLGADYYKVAMIPNNCSRCSYFSSWSGCSPCRFLLGQQFFAPCGTYCTLTIEQVRKVHGPMANSLDTVPNRGNKAVFLQYWLGTLADYESTAGYFWNAWTNSYCMSTPWLEVPGAGEEEEDEEPAHTHLPRLPTNVTIVNTRHNQLREIWHYVEENGVYPTIAAYNTVWRRFLQIGNASNTYVQQVISQSQAMRFFCGVQPSTIPVPPLDPVTGNPTCQMGYRVTNIAAPVGPIVDNSRVHDTTDPYSVITSVENRTEPTLLPQQPPAPAKPVYHAYNPSSDTAKRFAKYYDGWFKYFNRSTTLWHFNEFVASVGKFEDAKFSSFKDPAIKAAFDAIELAMPTADQVEPCKANGKNEAVLKDKSQRLTYDHGINIVCTVLAAAHTLENGVYGPTGLMYDASIKCRDRATVLDQFVEEHSKPAHVRGVPQKCCGLEIDQTGMELHERCDKQFIGSHGMFMRLLNQVLEHIRDKIDNPFFKACKLKIVKQKDGMYVHISIKKDYWYQGTNLKNGTAKLRIPDSCLTSGDLYTSLENFINETGALYAATTLNPEAFFAKDKTGHYFMNFHASCGKSSNLFTSQLLLEGDQLKTVVNDPLVAEVAGRTVKHRKAGKFNWIFNSIPLYNTEEKEEEPESIEMYQQSRQEGDDGGGRTHHLFSLKVNQDQVISNLRDLGFNGKLVTTMKGRLELVGAHFVFGNSVIDVNEPWIPAFSKNLAKLGVHATGNPRPADSWSRANALAINNGHRIPQLRRAFRSVSELLSKGIKDDDLVNVKLYSEINRYLGIKGVFRVAELQAKFGEMADPGMDLPMAKVVALVSNSVQRQITSHDLVMLDMLADKISQDAAKCHSYEDVMKLICCAGTQEDWNSYIRPALR